MNVFKYLFSCRVVDHTYTEPMQYKDENSCTKEHFCDVCGVPERELEHEWGDFKKFGFLELNKARTCKRCKETETRPVHVVKYETTDPDADWRSGVITDRQHFSDVDERNRS